MQRKVSWPKNNIKKYSAILLCGLAVFINSFYLNAMEVSANDLLMQAILDKNEKGVRKALNGKININYSVKKNSYHTPLSEAVATGNEHIVQMLLDYPGINLDTKLEHDWTALHIAAHHGSVPMVHMLVERGALLGVVNSEGRTPLHEIVCRHHIPCIPEIICQIPKKKIKMYVSKVALPLFLCFVHFKKGDGVAVDMPRDIQKLLCYYSIIANKEQLVSILSMCNQCLNIKIIMAIHQL